MKEASFLLYPTEISHDSERFDDFPKVTQLARGRAGIRNKVRPRGGRPGSSPRSFRTTEHLLMDGKHESVQVTVLVTCIPRSPLPPLAWPHGAAGGFGITGRTEL